MNKDTERDRLAQLYLDQTVGKECWSYQNYENVMEAFNKSPDGDITNMINYLQTHVMPLGTPLRELYHKASSWRAFDYYKEQPRPKLTDKVAYSIDMLMKLRG